MPTITEVRTRNLDLSAESETLAGRRCSPTLRRPAAEPAGEGHR
jgi:hypothetical protein